VGTRIGGLVALFFVTLDGDCITRDFRYNFGLLRIMCFITDSHNASGD